MIQKFPDGDILRDIIELLRKRVDNGLFMPFVKIRAHRGEFFNEMSDRWADKGALATDNVGWNCPTDFLVEGWREAAPGSHEQRSESQSELDGHRVG